VALGGDVREKHLIEIGGEELLGAARAAEIVAEQAALRRVATLVASGAEPEAVFARVTEEVGRVLGAASAGMVRYDGDARVGIVVGRWRGTHPQGYEVGQIVPLEGPTPVVRVWETGEPARIDAYDDVPGPIAERMRAAGFLSTVAAPIEVEGRLWGSVIVATAGPDPFPEDTAERLVGFAELVALGLASADAFEQLIASRARLVEAGDTARRHLARDLHDGAQQRLVSVGLVLHHALRHLDGDSARTESLLRDAIRELEQANAELRELARGLHPVLLTERGLGAACRALVERSLLPVTVAALPDDRYPEAVEVAAYYVASEAFANVAKYAGATSVELAIRRDTDVLVVEVRDDGCGGADPMGGSGLRGLSDRVEALQGTLRVDSELGAGTVIRANLPLN
jgi:signal transduction histidine kinase